MATTKLLAPSCGHLDSPVRDWRGLCTAGVFLQLHKSRSRYLKIKGKHSKQCSVKPVFCLMNKKIIITKLLPDLWSWPAYLNLVIVKPYRIYWLTVPYNFLSFSTANTLVQPLTSDAQRICLRVPGSVFPVYSLSSLSSFPTLLPRSLVLIQNWSCHFWTLSKTLQ